MPSSWWSAYRPVNGRSVAPSWVTAYCSGVRRWRSSARRSSDISSTPVDAGSVQSGWSHRRAALRLLAPVAAILALLTGAVIAAGADGAHRARPGRPLQVGASGRGPARGRGPLAELAGTDLGREATRADLDRAVGILTGVPTASPDPAAPAGAWVVNRLIVAAVGLEPERLGLQALATDDGRRLPMPPNFGSEVLARELGLVRNHRRDELERSRGEPVRLGNLAAMVDRARAINDEDRLRLARFRDIRLPSMSGARLAVVRAALAQVGQPYVWGGEWPSPASPRGPQAHGELRLLRPGLVGVHRRPAAPHGRARGDPARPDHGGRHGPRRGRRRAPIAALAPGDLVFFGDRGRRSRRGPSPTTGSSSATAGWSILGLARRRLGEPSGGLLAEGQAFGRRVAELGPA